MPGQSNMLDLINSDLNISHITRIYYSNFRNWQRDIPLPRYANGLIYMTGGCVEYYFGEESFIACKGDILKFPVNVVYSAKKLSDEPNTFYVIDFETVDTQEYDRLPLPYHFRLQEDFDIKQYFKRIYDTWNMTGIGTKILSKSYLYELVALLLAQYSSQQGSSAQDLAGVYKVSVYIQKHFADAGLDVKSLAKHFAISESQLRRNFARTYNISPLSYIHSQRISHAKNLLLYEDMPVSEVAQNAGFSSLYYFSRLFKQVTGLSPTQYKASRPV